MATVIGTNGNDDLTNAIITAAPRFDALTVDAGAGDDVIGGQFVYGRPMVTYTLGAGADTLLGDVTQEQATTVTDYQVGVDTLQLTNFTTADGSSLTLTTPDDWAALYAEQGNP